jgi:hypothetical protein
VVTAEGSWAVAPATPFEMSYRVIFERATADYRIDRRTSRWCSIGATRRGR